MPRNSSSRDAWSWWRRPPRGGSPIAAGDELRALRVLVLRDELSTGRLEEANGHSDEDDDNRADQVVPKKRDRRRERHDQDDQHARDRAEERTPRGRAFRHDRQDED